MALPSLLAPLSAQPRCSAVITDFDGTLAPIVEDPARAVPLPGVREVLARLSAGVALVWVVSGRPVAFLVDRLGPDLCLSGLYGLERWLDGGPAEVPEAERWRPVVAEAVARAQAELGAPVEDKGLSLTLHHRTRPERAGELQAWARAEAERSGLVVRQAKASLELHPPVETDKGTEVETLARGMEAACFIGDDLGDVAAFTALDRLAGEGVHTVRVAVESEESPAELLDRADLVVDGPAGALDLLEALASALPASPG